MRSPVRPSANAPAPKIKRGFHEALDSVLRWHTSGGFSFRDLMTISGTPVSLVPCDAWRDEPHSSAFCELEVRHLWRGDCSHEFEAVQVVADAVEQSLSAAEERRREIDFHLIHEAGGEILLRGVRASGEGYVFTAGGAHRQF